jgi:hypothetical protein
VNLLTCNNTNVDGKPSVTPNNLKMRTVLILGLILFLGFFSYGQETIKEQDNHWRAITKGKLAKIKKGGKINQCVIHYFKNDKSIFSINELETFRDDKTDKVLFYQFNFHKDTLFRVHVSQLDLTKHKNSYFVIYLDGNKIIRQVIDGEIYLPEIAKLKSKADEWLLKAKEIVQNK